MYCLFFAECRYFKEYLDGVTDQNDSPDDLVFYALCVELEQYL